MLSGSTNKRETKLKCCSLCNSAWRQHGTQPLTSHVNNKSTAPSDKLPESLSTPQVIQQKHVECVAGWSFSLRVNLRLLLSSLLSLTKKRIDGACALLHCSYCVKQHLSRSRRVKQEVLGLEDSESHKNKLTQCVIYSTFAKIKVRGASALVQAGEFACCAVIPG